MLLLFFWLYILYLTCTTGFSNTFRFYRSHCNGQCGYFPLVGTCTRNFLAGEAPALSLFGLGMADTTTHWLWVDPSLASWTPHHSAVMDPQGDNESPNQHSAGAMAMRGWLSAMGGCKPGARRVYQANGPP